MERTKYDLADDALIGNQQALVKKSLPNNKRRVTRRIPGGKLMMDPEAGSIHNEKDLADAMYTWLRFIRFFKDARISFANPEAKIATRDIAVADFDQSPDGKPMWEVQTGRKRHLAEVASKAIWSNRNVVSVTITKTGITLQVAEDEFNSKSEDWDPHMDFMPNYAAKGEYAVNR